MFQILHDSIFNPKALVKQVNRSGWFIFLHLLIMAIFMSLGVFVAYAAYDNSDITSANTGCSLTEGLVTCDGENDYVNDLYYIYGMRVYILNTDDTVDNIGTFETQSIVLQNDRATLYVNGNESMSFGVFSGEYDVSTFDEGIDLIATFVLISGIIGNLLSNFMLITAIVLISSLMFLRYKKVILYKKIFKLVTFAVTPVALLITFYHLLAFDMIIFFILSIFAYRTLYVLNRELYMQMMLRQMQQDQSNQDSSIVGDYKVDDFDNDEEDDEEDEDQ